MTTENPQVAQDGELQSPSLSRLITRLWRMLIDKLPFLQKGGAAIADQGLFAGSNFLINVLLARWMLPEEYGVFVAAYAIFLLMGSIYIAMLIEPMLVFGSGKYAKRWNRYLGVMLYGHWWLSILMSFVLIGIAYVNMQQGSSILAEAVLGLTIAQPFLLMNWTLRRAFYVNSQPHLAATGGALYLVVMLAGTFGAFSLGILSSFIALIVMAIASFVTSVWFMFLLKPIQLRQSNDDMSLLSVLKDHFHYGKWSTPTMLLTWITDRVYYVILPVVVGFSASGVLAASMNLIMPILHANTAISVLLAPSFVRALKYGGKEKLNQRTNFGLGIFTLTTGAYWILLMLVGNQLIDFIYNGQYNDSVNFPILFMMGLIPLTNGIGEIVSGSLRAIGKLNYIFWAHVATGIFTLTVSVGFLLAFDLTGAYVGRLLASALAAVIAYALYRYGLKRLKREDVLSMHAFDDDEAAELVAQRMEAEGAGDAFVAEAVQEIVHEQEAVDEPIDQADDLTQSASDMV